MKIQLSKSILFGQIINGFLSFSGLAIWARFAEPSSISSALIAGSFCLLLSDFIDFGGNAWINREVSHQKSSLIRVMRFLQPKVSLLLALSTLISIFFIVYTENYFLGLYLLIAPCYLLSAAYFQGMNLVRNVFFAGFFAQFLERLFWLSPAVFVLAGVNSEDAIYIGLIFGQTLSLGFMSILCYRIYQKSEDTNTEKFSLIQTYRLSSRLGLASVVSDLYSLDTLVVAHASTLTVAGEFSVIQKNRNVSILGFMIVANRLRLRVFKTKKSIFQFLQEESSLILFNLAGLLLVSIFSPSLLKFAFGQNYISLAFALRISCLSFLLLGIITILQSILSSLRDDNFLSYFTIFSVTFSLTSISVGAYASGVNGACLSLLISFTILCALLLGRIQAHFRDIA